MLVYHALPRHWDKSRPLHRTTSWSWTANYLVMHGILLSIHILPYIFAVLFQTWRIPAISISTFLFVKVSNDDVVGRCFTPFPINKFCGCTSQFQHPSVTIVCFRCAGSNSLQSLESSVCCQKELLSYTPPKLLMEAKSHPVAKENHLSQISMIVLQLLIFQGVICYDAFATVFWNDSEWYESEINRVEDDPTFLWK